MWPVADHAVPDDGFDGGPITFYVLAGITIQHGSEYSGAGQSRPRIGIVLEEAGVELTCQTSDRLVEVPVSPPASALRGEGCGCRGSHEAFIQ